MLLDLAGLDIHEKVMIQASTGNSREFENAANALVSQHPRIQVRESRRRSSAKVRAKAKKKERKAKSSYSKLVK